MKGLGIYALIISFLIFGRKGAFLGTGKVPNGSSGAGITDLANKTTPSNTTTKVSDNSCILCRLFKWFFVAFC